MSLRGVKMAMMLVLVAVCITACPVIDKVSVTPVGATLEVGQSLTLTASSTTDRDAPFTWTSSNPAVATIDATSGLSVNVTAVASGVATITVTGSKTRQPATATISVPTTPVEPEEAKVSVSPSSAVLEVGQALALNATSSDPEDTFNWTQTNAAAVGLGATTGATVNINALAAGVSVITATGSHSGATATATVSVLTAGGEIGTTPLVPAGLKANITNVTIPEDRRPVVTFTATNDRGDVIPLVELTSIRFIIAHLQSAPPAGNLAQFISYTSNAAGQATYDTAGAAGTTVNEDGTFTYKFKSALPVGFNAAETHAVGVQFNRLSALDGLNYPANATFEFRPDGGVVTADRDIVDTATCNNCHTRMGFHGGGRREVRLCIMCHNEASIDPDTGNTVDMRVMIHKIHMGENLPSVQAGTPYQIIGFQGSVNDYSTVAYPQDIRNCASCHVEDTKASQAGVWKTSPNRAACGACHDRVWFGNPNATPEGYENHPLDFEQVDDSDCAVCHTPTGPGVSPIDEAHYTIAQMPENPGLDAQITNVDVNPEDGTLTVDFHVTYGDGSPVLALADLDRLGSIVAWPASEYTDYVSEGPKGRTAPPGTVVNTTSPTGDYQYIYSAKLPLDPGLTFGIVATGRKAFTNAAGETEEEGIADNSLQFFTIDGSEPQPRREVVDDALCAKCHGGVIRGHGEQRVGVGTCVMCHNVTLGAFNFKDMLHKWHTGEELERPFSEDPDISETVAEVRFPGLRQQCSICHGKHSVAVPLAPEALPTVLETEAGEELILPERAACTTCHDSLMVDIHAVVNADAAQGVETCAVCHGAGKAEDVAAVHKLAP